MYTARPRLWGDFSREFGPPVPAIAAIAQLFIIIIIISLLPPPQIGPLAILHSSRPVNRGRYIPAKLYKYNYGVTQHARLAIAYARAIRTPT